MKHAPPYAIRVWVAGTLAVMAWSWIAERPSAYASLPPAAFAKNEPLIMENADHMEGSRGRGEYVLSGNVRFSHGAMRLETQRATWLKDQSVVYCESGMKLTQKGSLLTAERGRYDKNLGQAVAEGNVRMRDSSGEVEAFGNNLTYQRRAHLALLTGSPKLRRYYAAKAEGSDTAAKAKSPDAAGTGKIDTLTILGESMTYNDSARVAIAEGSVRITRNKMRITCRRAEYHDLVDSLFLIGEPLVVVDGNEVKGKIMRMGMHGEEISSLLVRGEAQANSREPATDTSAARESHVNGDSLFLAFKENAIDSVQVFRNAKGSYFDVDKPEYVNRMSGDYMVLRFAEKQISGANVQGGAKSTYFHFEEKKFKGKNMADGDTIDFAFRDGKVDEVLVRGHAKGTYYGAAVGKKDSTAASSKAPVTRPPVKKNKAVDAGPVRPFNPGRKK